MPKPTSLKLSAEKHETILNAAVEGFAQYGPGRCAAGIVMGRAITILIIAALISVMIASRREPSEVLHHV